MSNSQSHTVRRKPSHGQNHCHVEELPPARLRPQRGHSNLGAGCGSGGSLWVTLGSSVLHKKKLLSSSDPHPDILF